MPTFLDQTGYEVIVGESPQRIVSLVPSQTELLHHLELDSQISGITKFCIHPKPWVNEITKVGGTKSVKLDIIDQLNPDLIIANKEENTLEDVQALREKYPVWTSDINSVPEALDMIVQLGDILNVEDKAVELVNSVETGLEALERFSNQRVAYLIWNEPKMAVGSGNYIHDVLERIGLTNALGDKPRYPEVSLLELADIKLDFLFLSSEPFPFSEKHLVEFRQALPQTRIVLVDGEMFSWYGNRMVPALQYFQELRSQLSKV
jgi:ABC-type Fe3+-hydroxamate transport system substrate-binding protein